MTPSKRAKELGCKSLKQVASISGVHRGVLARWHKSKPWLFDAVCEKAMRENWVNEVMEVTRMTNKDLEAWLKSLTPKKEK